ncbi:MAG: hypothetical protein EA398_00275 [Deltaproteobacteria bacterium]|nr:MAG: hypothetical protein EA398_00275 [Deltaproteobacteria bacterium]
MSSTPHEDRFTALMQFAAGNCEVSQELSMSRKVRKLDLVYHFHEAPLWFGALVPTCSERIVIFEHESSPVARHVLASALVGQTWLAWKRIQPRAGRAEAFQRLRETARPPLVIVVADSLREDAAHAVPTLGPMDAPGVWSTADCEHGGLVLLETSALRAEDGYAFWSWAGRARTPEQASERLQRLLDDRTLPTLFREQLMEALMDNQIPHTDTEKESVYHRLRRELLEEGLQKGRQEGRQEGRKEGRQEGRQEGRAALLALAARLAPNRLAQLRGIEDLEALEHAVEAAIRESSGR